MGDARILIKDLGLRVISDDYEEIGLIVKYVGKLANEEGVGATREDVATALGDLIAEGHALAYRYREDLRNFEVASFAPGIVDDLWFYATPQGRLAVDQWNAVSDSPDLPSSF
jgi:hypothetical protein